MAFTLEDFCQQSHDILKANPGRDGRDKVRQLLEKLLQDEAFCASYLGDDQPHGMRTIFEDDDMGFVVLAYIMDEPRKSPPHDHGSSWAIYGQAKEYTDMTEYRRAGGGSGVGAAKLEQTAHYRLNPGQAGLYNADEIHAIDYPAGAKFVRVTGSDLNNVPRLKYDVAAGQALEIASVGVN
jgi:hypothetical protein